MALAATTILEVQTGGSDTNNGGGFDPGQTAGMFTDGAATSATTSAPVFTSASYNFVAGDAGHWLFIASGSNWTPGWYYITSVASNAATLNATIGSAVLLGPPIIPSTATGCATTGSPTGATWSIDYSQSGSSRFTYTDLATAGTGLVASSAGNPFGKQQVGNMVVITSGTNFNTGRYVLASVSGANGTFVGPTNISTGVGSGGNGRMGGAFASPGAACAIQLAGFRVFIKSGTYSITSASTNVAGGCLAPVAGGAGAQVFFVGYGSVRRDNGTPPVLQASGISSFNMVAPLNAQIWENLTFDGASLTTGRGFNSSTTITVIVKRCIFKNFTNQAVNASSSAMQLYQCDVTGCGTTSPAITGPGCFFCAGYSNTVTPFTCVISGNYMVHCLSYNNSGSSTDGFSGSVGSIFANCVAYNNGRHGINLNSATNTMVVVNCILYGNGVSSGTGYGVSSAAAANKGTQVINCAFGANQTGAVNTSLITETYGTVTLTADPFVASGSNNFAIANNSGGGALCRRAGQPGTYLDGVNIGYQDIGALQHIDLYGYSKSRIVNA